jgi:membrane protein required for colicin V production
MNLTASDIIFLILIAILMLRCALRGFLRELMSWASLVFGILAAILFYRPGGNFIREKFLWDAQVLPEIAAFIVLFLIVFFFIRFLELILRDIINRINIGGVDHFFGLLFGILEGLVLVSLILLMLYKQPLFDAGPLLTESVFARILLPVIGDIEENIFKLPALRTRVL